MLPIFGSPDFEADDSIKLEREQVCRRLTILALARIGHQEQWYPLAASNTS